MNILIREATEIDYPAINKMLLKLQNYHSENIPTIYKKLNSFYNNCPILNQDIETLKSRALLIKKTGEVLKDGLKLLGIPVLNKM